MELNEQQKAKQAVQFFENFITKETGREQLAKILDNLHWLLTRYTLESTDFTGYFGASNDLYYLRELRNICSLEYKELSSGVQ